MGMSLILVMYPTSFGEILSADHKGSTWAAWEQAFDSIKLTDHGQRSYMNLTSRTHVFMQPLIQLFSPTFSSYIHVATKSIICSNFQFIYFNNFWNI